MSGISESENQQNPKADKQTYLYHKQEVQRRRMPPDFRPTGGARKGPAKNLAQETLFRNMRIFGGFFLLMVFILIIAVTVAKKGWQMRRKEMEASRPVRELPVKALEKKEPADGRVDMPTDAELLEEGPTLDTSAIRKAIFMAKRGKRLADAGDYDGAIELYMDALDVWPHLVQVWADLGQAHLLKGQYSKAEVALSKAAEQDPANPQILNDLGVTYLYQGGLDKAEELFTAASEIDENFSDSYFNIALCNLARGKKGTARDNFETYLRMKPGNARVLKELAYLDASEGNYDPAIEKLTQAMEDMPDWSVLYYDAAAASALSGKLEATFRYLEQAMDLTSPQVAYRVYQQPAFKEMRQTELGEEFEKTLADATRELLNDAQEMQAETGSEEQAAEPLSSVTSVSSESTESNGAGD